MNLRLARFGTLLALIAAPLAVSAEQAAGSVSGAVTYTGAVPRKADPDDFGQRRPLFAVDAKSAGLADTLVYLEPIDAAVKLPPNDANDAAVTITQRDFTFEPHVIVVAPGQAVVFGNDDPANHNVRAETANPRIAFNVITTPDQTYETAIQGEPSRKPIHIACDVHPWMAGWVYVFEHRLFALTDENGAFCIEDVPPGAYAVVIEQPDGGLIARATVNVSAGTCVRFSVGFEMAHLNSQSHPAVTVHNTK